MYGKIFDSIYAGSLYGEFEAIVVFKALIVLADEIGIVDSSPQALAGRTSYPLDVIKKGLAVLQRPDPDSRHPEEDGRRIIPLGDGRSFGWLIVNYKAYRDMATRADKREADKTRIANKRNPSKTNDVAECREVSQGVADVAYTDTDTDTDIKTKKRAPAIADPHRQRAIGMGVPVELWDEYMKTRKRLKASNTPQALTTLINKLETQRDAGHDPVALIESANEQGWKTIYPPRDTTNGRASGASSKPDIGERLQDRSWFTGIIVDDCISAGD